MKTLVHIVGREDVYDDTKLACGKVSWFECECEYFNLFMLGKLIDWFQEKIIHLML